MTVYGLFDILLVGDDSMGYIFADIFLVGCVGSVVIGLFVGGRKYKH